MKAKSKLQYNDLYDWLMLRNFLTLFVPHGYIPLGSSIPDYTFSIYIDFISGLFVYVFLCIEVTSITQSRSLNFG